jgi:ComF family protein
MVNNWLNNILSRSLAASCQLCGSLQVSDNLDLCPACYEALPWLPAACPRCANPLPAAPTAKTTLCGQCQQAPPAFDSSLALFRYEAPLDRLIQDLKFHGQLSHARLLGTLMANYLAQWQHEIDCIIPVPLHPGRLRERGFNQALELARPVAKQLNLDIDTRHCQRLRYTDGQAGLPLARRRANVRNAFSVGKATGWRHVAIIDDVMTSGQTANTLARALKRSGIDTVSVWSCCRATIDG